MRQIEKTRKAILEHCTTYPNLEIQDIFKFLYQSSLGCEHMVSSLDDVILGISKEYDQLRCNNDILIDLLDGAYSRVHLNYLNKGLCAKTLGKIVYSSAKTEPSGMIALKQKLEILKNLMGENKLPFSHNDFDGQLKKWGDDGYPAIHHSDAFRKEYHPSYRVIANKYARFLPLFAKIDTLLNNGPTIIAVDGGSASGKTTLSEMVKEIYDCSIFHMDDFFLRPHQKTDRRYAEIGGNVDRERFLQEVLIPLKKNTPVFYRRYNCKTLKIESPIKIPPKKLTVVEGAYSMHPELFEYYDFSVFLDITPELQKQRILKRNESSVAKQFFEKWIPLENIYFSETQIKERCQLCISVFE